jgi:hypothetical protein
VCFVCLVDLCGSPFVWAGSNAYRLPVGYRCLCLMSAAFSIYLISSIAHLLDRQHSVHTYLTGSMIQSYLYSGCTARRAYCPVLFCSPKGVGIVTSPNGKCTLRAQRAVGSPCAPASVHPRRVFGRAAQYISRLMVDKVHGQPYADSCANNSKGRVPFTHTGSKST